MLLARGNGLFTRYCYDPLRFRLQRQRTERYDVAGLVFQPQSGTTSQDTAYTYDLRGNLLTLTERTPQSGVAGADELSQGFTYDALYRLLSATGRENQPTAPAPWEDSARSAGAAATTAYTQYYTYDAVGNMQRVQHVAANSRNSFTRRFAYASTSANRLVTWEVGSTSIAYEYDAAGNVTQEGAARHFRWDALDQLRQFAVWTGPGSAPSLLTHYAYSGTQRAKKLVQTGPTTWQVTVYVEGWFEHRYEVRGGTLTSEQTTCFVSDEQSILYQRRTGDTLGDQRPAVLYSLPDHLGSASLYLSASGALVSREEYYPFGGTSFGSTEKQRYRFCGKERDAESGLYYYGARYYAPWLCRFVSSDPLATKYAYFTPYQYAGNKPLTAVDVDGLEGSGDKPSPTQETTHPLKIGESLASVAHKAHVPLDQVRRLNPNLPPDRKIPVGTVLRLRPEPQPAQSPSWWDQASESASAIGNEALSWIKSSLGLDEPPVTPGAGSPKAAPSLKASATAEQAKSPAAGPKTTPTTIKPVIPASTHVGQEKGKCFAACKKMVNLATGLELSAIAPVNKQINVALDYASQGRYTVPTADVKRGVQTIDKYLEAGKPIIIGVSRVESAKYYNHNHATEHYVVVVGRGSDRKGTFYQFYDVATQHQGPGTSSDNKLYVQGDGLLVGVSQYSSKPTYTMTEVRPNK